MNKKILFSIILGSLVLPLVGLAQLQPYAPGAPMVGNIWNLMGNIESLLWFIFETIVIVCFVMAGILFLTAQGAPEKLNAAKSAFIWGIVGVIVGIVAYSIIAIVSGALGGGWGGWQHHHRLQYGK